MSSLITPDDLLTYHKATGIPISAIRGILERLKPEILERVMIAARTETSGKILFLTDPIEQDPTIKKLVEQAGRQAELSLNLSGVLGACHVIWAEQAKILKEAHGITWFSPSQMNPDILMD